MQFANEIEVNAVNLNGQTVEGSAPQLTTGWHKLVLKSFSDEKQEKNGGANGALFRFEAVEPDQFSGVSFNRWYCVQAFEAKSKWRQTVFENIMVRIAQCVGVQRLENCEQLIDKPFYAFIVAKEIEYESTDTDRSGNFIKKKRLDVDFNKGLLTEQFLSCEEYAHKSEPVDLGDDPF